MCCKWRYVVVEQLEQLEINVADFTQDSHVQQQNEDKSQTHRSFGPQRICAQGMELSIETTAVPNQIDGV